MHIRPFAARRDDAHLRECVIQLQEAERALDARLPPGEDIADSYIALLHERCAAWQGRILIAEDEDGTPLGIACVFAHVPSTEPDEPAGTYAMLNDVVVLPAARRRGIGRELLRAAEAFARERGAAVIRLEVMADNGEALELYETAGFLQRLVQMEKRLDD